MTQGTQKPLLLSIPSYKGMANQLLASGLFESAQLKRKKFPDREVHLRNGVRVRGRHVVVVCGTHDPHAFMELTHLVNGLGLQGVRQVTVVNPYFAYSTQERAQLPGEYVTAKTTAVALSKLHYPPNGLTYVLFDTHTPDLPNYFETPVTASVLSGRPFVQSTFKELSNGRRVVLGTADAGRMKYAESMASHLEVPLVSVFKRRCPITNKITISAMRVEDADIEGASVVIYDDMIRTGGSIIKAADAYIKAGAIEVYAIASHGVLPRNALEKLQNCGHVKQVIVTDSHPRVRYLAPRFPGFLVVKSLAPLILAKAEELGLLD